MKERSGPRFEVGEQAQFIAPSNKKAYKVEVVEDPWPEGDFVRAKNPINGKVESYFRQSLRKCTR